VLSNEAQTNRAAQGGTIPHLRAAERRLARTALNEVGPSGLITVGLITRRSRVRIPPPVLRNLQTETSERSEVLVFKGVSNECRTVFVVVPSPQADLSARPAGSDVRLRSQYGHTGPSPKL
jgi:hypothetical protein